tara:strand:+ start:111 stop:251 length:141 start_codon:yes stop_codon:yes gene_type:complete
MNKDNYCPICGAKRKIEPKEMLELGDNIEITNYQAWIFCSLYKGDE